MTQLKEDCELRSEAGNGEAVVRGTFELCQQEESSHLEMTLI